MIRALFIIPLFFSSLAFGQSLNINVFDEHELYIKYSRSYSVAWKLLQQAAKQAEIELHPHEDAWIRSISFLKNAKGVNVVFGALPSNKRKQWTTFSPPLSVEHIAAYTTLGSKYNSFEDLLANKDKLDIGVTRGSIHQDVASFHGFKYTYTVINRNRLFKMLEANKVDAIIYTHAITAFYCAKFNNIMDNKCVKQLGDPIQNSTLHFIFNGDDKRTGQLVHRLNNQIQQLFEDGRIQPLFLSNGYSQNDYNFWAKKYQIWLKEQ